MRNKRLIKKAATLLMVLLMLGSFFGVTAMAGDGEPDGAYGATNPDYRISDSHYLRLPDDLKDYPPVVPPVPHEAKDMEDPSAIEMYNVTTGEVTRIPSNESGELGLNSTLPFEGLLPPSVVPESVFPPDDRARITNTGTYPWRTVCKLFVTWPDGNGGGCSGAIIGCPDGHGYHVLTAGHCVYSHTHGGWATSVKVVPGLDHNYMPYNYAWATYLRSYTGWTQYADHRYDWALVTIDRNVGDYTGWMGRMTADPSDPVYTGILNTAGYPCNVYDPVHCPYPVTPSNTMWWDADYGRTANEYNHWYYMDTQPGQSGSPVWVYYPSSGNRYILTIHAYGNDGSGSNHGTRLNQDKFDRIITWCNADTPPTDYADLIDDGQTYSGFSPTTVKPGTTSFHAWCDVRNVGTASSGGFYVCYYASENTVISTYDDLIGCDYVSSIDPFSWKDSDWTGTFPSGVPDGEYWVGWIIDSGNHVTEFDETNNVAYKNSYKLLVDGTPPSATISINSGATYTTTTSVTLSLTYSDGGSGVDRCRYKNSGGSWTSWQACMPTKAWTLTSGDGTKTVYYQVRDKAGNIRQVYDTIILDTTNPPAPVISSSTHPDENVWYCNRNPTFTWTTPSDPSGIACYSYILDHSSTTTPDKICDTTGNSKSYTNLAYGTWYFHVRAKDNAGNWGPADHYRVQLEDCDLKDGCYAYDNGCEDRDYYCDGSVCKYTGSNRHTDYYDDWVNYCRGDEVRKHRLFHDFYCEGGSCKDHTSWKDDQLVENCNVHDGWYDTGDTRWVDDPANECKEKEQKKQEYRDYTCSGGACTYSVTTTQWIDTGNVRNKPDGTVCGCTANNTLKECYDGTCTDTGICNSTICGADVACDGKKPGENCNADRTCNATCKCILPAEKPDLEITEEWVCWPDNCTICYNVTNIGNGTVPKGHNTTLYVDGEEVAHDLVDVNLAPNASYIGCFKDYIWTYIPPGDNITVCADNNSTIDESNETNNCLTNIWTCGDVNCNGVVDMSDVIDLLYYVGYPGQYTICNHWAADVNCDKRIDMSDVIDLLYYIGYPGQYELKCCCIEISG